MSHGPKAFKVSTFKLHFRFYIGSLYSTNMKWTGDSSCSTHHDVFKAENPFSPVDCVDIPVLVQSRMHLIAEAALALKLTPHDLLQVLATHWLDLHQCIDPTRLPAPANPYWNFFPAAFPKS